MNSQRDGFTLIEMMIVAVLLAATLGAVYQALNVQELSYRTGTAVIRGEEGLRNSLGILEMELREVSTTGTNNGGVDIGAATPDSVVFRAQRKLGFVCATAPGDNKLTLAVMGDPFTRADSIVIFVDDDPLISGDDSWVATNVQDAATDVSTACATRFPTLPVQTIHVGAGVLTNVQLFSPIRGFEWVAYGIRQLPAPSGWSLARRTSDGRIAAVVEGLAPPPHGLRFEYFDGSGNATTVPSQITRMRMTLQMDPDADGAPGQPLSLSTNLFFRNN